MNSINTGPLDRVVSLFSGVAALGVVGHGFAWIFARSYFESLGFAWLSPQLTWPLRYGLCDAYLQSLAVAFSSAFVLGTVVAIRSTDEGAGLARWAGHFVIAGYGLATLMSAAVVFARAYNVAHHIALATLASVSASAALALAWALQPMFSGTAIVFGARFLLVLGALIIGLFGTPKVLGQFAAHELLATKGEALSRVDFGDSSHDQWRLLLAQDKYCYIVKFGTDQRIETLRIVEAGTVVITAKRP